jgi:hypothetical protein
MDITTLAMAKKYTDQKAGYSEWTDGSIRWDGDTTDKIMISGEDMGVDFYGSYYVRVTEKVIPSKNITKVTCYNKNHENGIYWENFRIEEIDGIAFVYCETYPIVIVIDAPDAPEISGTYAVDVRESLGWYVATIDGKLTETIHPIDKKYLPSDIGGGLPVVELETAINTTENFNGGFSQADSEKMTVAHEKCVPITFKITIDGYEYVQTFARMDHEVEGSAFQTAMMVGGFVAMVLFMKTADNIWMYMIGKMGG